MKDKSNTSLGQVVSSVFAAMMGVQSDKNRERDFNAANPRTYLIVGIVFTVIFITTIVTVVSMVVS